MTTKHVYHFIGGKRSRHSMASRGRELHDVYGIMILPPSDAEFRDYDIHRRIGAGNHPEPTEYRVVATEAFTNGIPKEDGTPADIEAVYYMIPASVSPNHEALFMAQCINGLYRNEAELQTRIDLMSAIYK